MSQNYTVKQVAQILGYSTNSIYAFLKEGRIKGVRVGSGRFRITQEELQRVLHLKKTAQVVQVNTSNEDIKITNIGQNSIQKNIETYNIFNIHFDVSSLFDWFIGTGSILLGSSLLLYSKYLATSRAEPYLLLILPVQLTFLFGGMGILLTNIFSKVLSVKWHKIFHIVLTVNYITYIFLKVQFGDMGGVVLFGFLALVLTINLFTKLRGMESFLLFISSYTIGVCFLLFLNPSYFDFVDTIKSFEQYYRHIFFSLFIISLVSAILLWWAHQKRRSLFWILMIDYGLNFIIFSLLLIGALSWDKAIFHLITGLTCVMVPLWEWISLFREKAKGKVLLIHLFMLLVLIFTIVWIWVMEFTIKDYSKKDLQSKAEYASLIVESVTDSVKHKVNELSRNVSIIETLKSNNEAGNVEALKISFEGSRDIRRLLVIKENGELFSIYPYVKLTQSNFAFREYFKVPIRENRIYISDSFEATDLSRRRVTTISNVLKDKDGNILGVIVASIDLDQLGARLQEFANSRIGEYVSVTDKNKIRIIHPDKTLVGSVLNSSNSLISKQSNESKGLYEGYAFNGKKMLQAFNTVKSLDWYVQVQIPIITILSPTRGITFAFFVVTTAIVIIQGLVVFYLLKRPDT